MSTDPNSLLTEAKQAVWQMELEMSDQALSQCIDHLLILSKWNQVHNLTAIRDLEQMLIKHVFDSLAIAPFINGDSVLDIGSGAGFPGIPLALCYPEKQFVLLDSRLKKTSFLMHVKQQLALDNVDVVHQAVENYISPDCFTTCVTRAFSNLMELLHKTRHLCCNKGSLLVMQGKYPSALLQKLSAQGIQAATTALQVPGLSAERHLVQITYED